MNLLSYIFILLLPLCYSYPHRYSNDLNDFLNMHMKQRPTNYDETGRKFGSSRQNIFRFMPLNYHQQIVQNPVCLPQVWTCGPGLPPCCSGLMCYDGNAKRGRYCVARG